MTGPGRERLASAADDVPQGAVTPGHQGRFGDFDVLGQADRWDEPTRTAVLGRLHQHGSLRFFGVDEEPTVRALVDLLLAQHEEPRVPVVELIDARLVLGETDGWRYEDMPSDGEAWRQSLSALDRAADAGFGHRFHEIDIGDQGELVQRIQNGDVWEGFDANHLWSLWTRYACTAFYSHPWAWNEIGFGGPAYPRGYKNIGLDRREPWERAEIDAHDPVPWADRAEAARRTHARRTGRHG